MQMAPGLARDVFTVLIAAAGLAACGNNVQTLPVGQATAISHVRPSDRTERVVYSFRGKPDGWNPFGSLTADNDGTIYGTTFGGGSVGFGTVFALKPSHPGYSERVIYNFLGNPDGSGPFAGVTLDGNGSLYGTTQLGGEGVGTVFKLTPSSSSGYTESILHQFRPGPYGDGVYPYAPLIFDKGGELWGATLGGGYCCGVLFKVTPSGSGSGESGVWGFENSDGNSPYGGLVLDTRREMLYGTTESGLNAPNGTVYEFPPARGGFPTTIHTFSGLDGANPRSAMILDAKGALYGTTVGGGAYNSGVVFRLARHNHLWTESVLYSFTGYSDGASPYGSPLLGRRGIIYGTTKDGGAYGQGVVYALKPSSTGYTDQTVYNFGGKPDGSSPISGLILGKKGSLLGTTAYGGRRDRGTVFEINP
jgi:uncharacterized repeat protein (TIGR03803 family)